VGSLLASDSEYLPMVSGDLIFVVFLNATLNETWSWLTGDFFTRNFLGPVETDWEAGSRIRFLEPSWGMISPDGDVLLSSPPNLLSYTWPDPNGLWTESKVSLLTWRLDSVDSEIVKLKLVHAGLTEDARSGMEFGWATRLQCLKIDLEAANGRAEPVIRFVDEFGRNRSD